MHGWWTFRLYSTVRGGNCWRSVWPKCIVAKNTVTEIEQCGFLHCLFVIAADRKDQIHSKTSIFSRIRGTLGSLLLVCSNIGLLISFVVGTYVDYSLFPRIMIVLPFIFLISFYFLPETPQYLLQKDKVKVRGRVFFWINRKVLQRLNILEMGVWDGKYLCTHERIIKSVDATSTILSYLVSEILLHRTDLQIFSFFLYLFAINKHSLHALSITSCLFVYYVDWANI